MRKNIYFEFQKWSIFKMNRKWRPTKSGQQIKDEQIGLILERIEKDIENFKIIISEKDKQLCDLKIF